MDEDRWTQKQFKWVGGSEIQINIEFLSPNYCAPVVASSVRTSQTGHLELFRLEPQPHCTGLPSFSVRWDYADDTADVDLIDGDVSGESKQFALQKQGYRGHKTVRVNENPRTQAIDIEAPRTGPVFKGTISLIVDLGLNFSESINLKEVALAIKTDASNNQERTPGGS